VLVEDVPLLTLNDINQVRRFITLVDAFYDNHVKLIISAAVAPEHLFMPEGQGSCQMSSKGARGYVPATQDEVFAFARTLSRLNEMRSHAYLIRHPCMYQRGIDSLELLFPCAPKEAPITMI